MSGECLGRFGDFLGFFGIFLTYGTKSEQDGDNQAERSLGERCSLFRSLSGRASRSCNTKSDEKDRIGGGTPEVDGTTTEIGGEDPGQHDEDHLESRGNQTQGKGGIGLDAGLLEEVDGLVGNEVTSQVLGEVDTTDDHGAAKVDTLEQLNVVGLLGALLHLDGRVELLNGLLVLLLVEQQLAVVVVDVGHLGEVLHAAAECGHGRGDGAHLVLCDTELDVREDEGLVQVNGALVVLGGLAELGLDEVQLGAVVEDVRVLLVLGEGGREVSLGGLRVGC